ncbi:class I SAM-dependent methyltransferase [Saccharopolyspora taberi]|uniref:Methyltransferase domain-containing protein n=1 Tax=Saccharopolyspora taberi TaxID=60895 RepID=A0ABN3VHR6_9PSEU
MGIADDARDLGAVFSAAQTEFEDASAWVWDPMGQALVILASPEPGERVLDACCGAGASAVPAGHAVAPGGKVDAIDLADGLLDLGRRRAHRHGVTTVDFVRADVTTWEPDQLYDLVLCGYGVFFLPDMDVSVKRLIGLLRGGGRFGVSAWWRPAVEEFGKALMDTVATFRTEPAGPPSRAQAPSLRIATPETMRSWLESLELRDITVRPLKQTVPLTADRAWNFVLGSGFRGALTALAPDAIPAVRKAFLSLLEQRNIAHLDISTLIACGTRS